MQRRPNVPTLSRKVHEIGTTDQLTELREALSIARRANSFVMRFASVHDDAAGVQRAEVRDESLFHLTSDISFLDRSKNASALEWRAVRASMKDLIADIKQDMPTWEAVNDALPQRRGLHHEILDHFLLRRFTTLARGLESTQQYLRQPLHSAVSR